MIVAGLLTLMLSGGLNPAFADPEPVKESTGSATMPDESPKTLTEEQFHKKMAVDLFNHTWDLMDKPDRTPEDDIEMVHSAHASRWHWGKVGTPLNFQRGEWQVSRVYAILKRAEPALYHAQRCLALTETNDISGFDLGFAHEATARAHAIAGNDAEAAKGMKLARAAAGQLEKKEDREYFEGELKTIPGWGN